MNAALAGLTFLVIGDSHMAGRDYLLLTLHDALEAQGAVVHSYGMCGAMAENWVNTGIVACGRGERHDKGAPVEYAHQAEPTWKIDDLIQKTHPNVVVIELADAMAGYGQDPMPKAWIYQQIRALTGRIHAQNIGCVWVGPIWGNEGPPYHKVATRVKEMSDFLAQSVAPCAYVDSTKFATQGQWPTTDGQHLTASGYRSWGGDIADQIARLKAQNQLK